MLSNTTATQLPPLPTSVRAIPELNISVQDLYTADQLQAYARTVLEQLRCDSAQGVPAGWKLVGYLYDFKDNGVTIPDWFTSRKAEAEAPGHFNVRECYIPAPSQAQQAEPMSEQQFSELWDRTIFDDATQETFEHGVGLLRLIEAAHGIKEQP